MAFKLKRLKAIAQNMFKMLSNFYDGLSGSSSYGKFVVIGQERTGSNLLITLLQSHPKIRAKGGRFMRLGGKSCREVLQDIFPKKSNKTIGFKLFYSHPLDSVDRSIWNILEEDPGFKIIHLQRRNLLRAHISKLIAVKTGVWISSGKKISSEEIKVHIDIEKMLADFEAANTHIKDVRNKFKSHKVIEIRYEDLVEKREETVKRILNFLEVKEMHLKSHLTKINTSKIEDIVLNYKELKERLGDTKYAFMLYE